jgi:hypothetical protein
MSAKIISRLAVLLITFAVGWVVYDLEIGKFHNYRILEAFFIVLYACCSFAMIKIGNKSVML